MESEPARETVRTLPIYRGDERPDKGGETVWLGIIQLPLQADILREDQLNRPLYDKKLAAPAPKDITIVPYVSCYFMKGSEFDVKPPACFLCGKFH